ncbi:5'-nucleotidase C-terminal domain-containing protein [Clostridium sp.]|uniref:bifunctional metallophosphatase/5'-nucleotidase n=1 Tax=Clostridium sp. TaxID=1506 RepID=UPI00321750AF
MNRGESRILNNLDIDNNILKSNGKKNLTILATTDVHGNIWGYNYENDEETKNNGMARVYSYVEKVRAENPNTILVDNGDIIQGTILTDYIYNKQSGEHPVISAMNYMGYEAMVLGNHEFNVDLDLISRMKEQGDFPLLSANTTYKKNGENFVEPYIIIEISGMKVGIIGLTTPNVPRWVGDKVEELNFHGLGETARKYVNEIKDEVDVIMVMAHASMEAEYDKKSHNDAANRVLDLCPEVDILMTGHFHITIEDKIGKALVGGSTDSGREVVRFDLTLDENNNVVDSQVKVIDMKNYIPSEKLRQLPIVRQAHEKTVDFTTGEVYGRAWKDFQPIDEIKWIPQGKLQDTPIINLINKVQLLNSGADVSSTSLIRDDSDIKAGNINYGSIVNIYKFDTLLYVVEVTGAELKEYMEWVASAYNQWKPGDISISFSMDIPGYLYDMFAGVDYNIDISKSVGQRIVDVMFKGNPLEDERTIKLAISDYAYFTTLKARNIVKNNYIWKSNNLVKDMLVKYIAEQGVIEPEVSNNWEIVGVNLESPYREQVINMVNKGEIDVPYNHSLNIYELRKTGIIK